MSFAYARAESVQEARLLAAAGGSILAGGQSLMPLVNRGDVRPTMLVDVNRIEGLDAIVLDGDTIEIGALARLETVRTNPLVRRHLPLLAAALAFVANPAVRMRGTLVGNLVNFGAGAEAVAVAMLQGALLIRATPDGRQSCAIGADHQSHFAVAVRLPISPAGTRAGFYEVQRRSGHLGQVGVGVAIEAGGRARAVASGLLAEPLIMPHVAAAIEAGATETAPLAQALGEDLAGRLVRDDLHATARYRELVAPAVIRRSLAHALGAEAAR